MWGDAPYSKALNGDLSGLENTLPAYDNQEDIYMGIIADLKKANDLLSKNAEEYNGLGEGTDLIYNNDPTKWRKMANSLLLRYYMRISAKLPDVAQTGMEEIMADQSKYPIITSSDDDATMGFAGNTPGDSWPNNTVSDPSTSNYRRIRMCETFVDRLQTLNDPRLAVWANKVVQFIITNDDKSILTMYIMFLLYILLTERARRFTTAFGRADASRRWTGA